MLGKLFLIAGLLIAPVAFGQEQKENSLLVGLERTACLGKCPVYSLVVLNNGKVIFNGERFTAVQGKKEFEIPQESVNAIETELKRIHFSKYSKEYTRGSWGCFSYATDHSTIKIKATIKSKEKSVVAYLGCSSKKIEELYALSQLIDNVVGTSTLVKGSESSNP